MERSIKEKNFWKRGAGSIIMAAVISLLAFAFICYIVVSFGRYNAMIQSQVLADVIADGTTSYAKNEMNLSKVALKSMADKLYEANKDIGNGVTITGIDYGGENVGHLVQVAEVVGSTDLLTTAEKKKFTTVTGRSTIMDGDAITIKYQKGFDPGFRVNMKDIEEALEKGDQDDKDEVWEGIKDLYKEKKAIVEKIHYHGPRYMDEIFTINISAECKIPFMSNLATATRSSTVLSMADVPYNSRVCASNPSLQTTFAQLEAKAYEEVEMGESEKQQKDGHIVRYNSIRAKIFLEARRALGDGFNMIDINDQAWPGLPRTKGQYANVVINISPQDTKYKTPGYNFCKNYLKDCYNFVSSCFHFDGLNGLEDARTKLVNTSLQRDLEYTRAVSVYNIWKQMHPEEKEVIAENNYRRNATGFFDGDSVFKCTIPFNSDPTGKRQPYRSISLDTSENDVYGKWYVAKREVIFNNGFTQRVKYTLRHGKGKSFATMLDEYSRDDPSDPKGIWKVGKQPKVLTDKDLMPGDILIWSDPNWRRYIMPEIAFLAGQKKWDNSFNERFGKCGPKVSHYCIYFGDDPLTHTSYNILHMTGAGVNIGPLDYSILNPPSGSMQPVVCAIIRFKDDGSEDAVGSDAVQLEWVQDPTTTLEDLDVELDVPES